MKSSDHGQEKIEIPKNAVVIGGGVVGIWAALTLADANIHVTLLTRARQIGGKAIRLTHFYDRAGEVSSWFMRQMERVKKHPNIHVKTSVEMKGFEGHLGDYRAEIEHPVGKREVVKGAAVILATGYDVVPNTEGIFGHRRFISPTQMEAMLQDMDKSLTDEKGKPIETVTFILDLVNETVKIDSANAVKNAILLKKDHDCTVYVVCRDVKVSLDGMEKQYRKAREMGIIFIKYDDPPKFSLVNGQINLEVREVSTRMRGDEYVLSILTDLVVVSERFVPSKDSEVLAGILGIPLSAGGYLMDDNPQFSQVKTNRRGVFLAGGCRYPQPLDEALVEAEAAASEVTQLVSQGVYAYDLAVAEIDPTKCALCLTCSRVCPHLAIVVEKYAEKNVYHTHGYEKDFKWSAARVLPTQCYGCGICVGSCPTKAITLNHPTDAEISLQMGYGSEGRGLFVEAFVPRIVAFCCDKSGYVAADMAGRLGMSLPESVDIIRVPCAGRIDTLHLLQALENGADGVLIFACHEENCQSLTGDLMATARMGYVYGIMESIGLERERLELCNLATNSGPKFAETVRKKFDDLKKLGPSPVK